jgi:hypothetical protein
MSSGIYNFGCRSGFGGARPQPCHLPGPETSGFSRGGKDAIYRQRNTFNATANETSSQVSRMATGATRCSIE